ncbi:MAG: aminoacyl-tRNA hydrolase [Treponema sp.]|jgi:PTH1 family peptidyl-tRNA hydrolase|nr:aminoacyl-tRNA hydrolase [Treponema sp.]
MIQLAAFLGNPGREYERNRHNAGRMLAQALPFYASLSWQRKFKGFYASRENQHFIMPETYMNLSGESVFAAAAFYKIKIEEIIVIHDELELPLGTISLKYSGGLGGHNGLRSMKKCFGSADFWRLRIGLGRPDSRLPGEGGHEGISQRSFQRSGEGITDWVLSDFSGQEIETLTQALDAGAGLLLQALSIEEPETLLPEWAKKKVAVICNEISSTTEQR